MQQPQTIELLRIWIWLNCKEMDAPERGIRRSLYGNDIRLCIVDAHRALPVNSLDPVLAIFPAASFLDAIRRGLPAPIPPSLIHTSFEDQA